MYCTEVTLKAYLEVFFFKFLVNRNLIEKRNATNMYALILSESYITINFYATNLFFRWAENKNSFCLLLELPSTNKKVWQGETAFLPNIFLSLAIAGSFICIEYKYFGTWVSSSSYMV